jgi:hypothetical protein
VNRVSELYGDGDAASFARGYLDYLTELLGRVDVEAVAAFARELLDARERRAHIFFLGTTSRSAARAGRSRSGQSVSPTTSRR